MSTPVPGAGEAVPARAAAGPEPPGAATGAAPALALTAAMRTAAPALAGRARALVRVQAAARQLVPQAQYWIARVGPAGQAGLVALTAAVVLAVSAVLPAQHALEAVRADLARAQHPGAAQSIGQAAPRLVASLPTRAQIPAVLGQMFAQAKAAGVSLDKGRYTFSAPRAGELGRYEVEFPLKAAYPDVRAFIDHTLTAVPAAALTRLRIERKVVGDTTVNADVGFAIYLRGE